jgi:hypothetical protein
VPPSAAKFSLAQAEINPPDNAIKPPNIIPDFINALLSISLPPFVFSIIEFVLIESSDSISMFKKAL